MYTVRVNRVNLIIYIYTFIRQMTAMKET